MKNIVSIRKLLQALYYIQGNAAEANASKTDIMYLLKILFFADRYHLRHYGVLASGDTYYAMKNGPVASAAKNIIEHKMPPGANSAEMGLLDCIESLSEYDYAIKPQDTDELSESFIKSLRFSLENFGMFDKFELGEISHSYPEWNKHKANVEGGGAS